MTPIEINNLAEEIHNLNRKWWPDDVHKRDKQEILILIVSEIIECMEGERKDLMDDKLPHRKMAEVEMADTAIRVLDAMGAFKFVYTVDHSADNWFSFEFKDDSKAGNLFAMVGVVTRGGTFHKASTFMSNILWLVIQYCEKYGYDLWGAVREKLEYNKTRYDHTDEGRAAAGGKKW